jgi:hypothetical protein
LPGKKNKKKTKKTNSMTKPTALAMRKGMLNKGFICFFSHVLMMLPKRSTLLLVKIK